MGGSSVLTHLAVSGYRDQKTFKRVYEVDTSEKIPVRFFARGFEYKFLGLIRTDRHIIGVGEGRACGRSPYPCSAPTCRDGTSGLD